MREPKDSVIVKALADIASQGNYNVNPKGARTMNEVFEMVAGLINRLEAREAEQEASIAELVEEANFAATIAAEEEENDEGTG